MNIKATCLLVCGLFLWPSSPFYAQVECLPVSGLVFSSPQGDVWGTCLVATPENDGVFVAGYKKDSTLIMEVDLAGNIMWSISIDVFPTLDEFPSALIVDGEGRIVVTGVGGAMFDGRVYAMRIDPDLRAILWSKEYPDGPTNYVYTVIVNDNGNYLLNTNPRDYPGSHIDVDLFEINKNSGAVVASFTKKYTFFGTETLGEIIYHNGFVYGTGRYKDGGSVANFRHVITKLDADNGDQIWSRFGHVPRNMAARFYGQQILIHNNEIITGYVGDPDGTSLEDNEFFIQKTTLDGDLLWCNRYVLAGQTQTCHDIIYSDNGFVVLAGQLNPERESILFKIDHEGNLIWSSKFSFSIVSDFEIAQGGNNRLSEIGSNLMFAGTGTSGLYREIVLVKTNLEGRVNQPCVESEDYEMEVIPVTNPVFYTGNPTANFDAPVAVTKNTTQKDALIAPADACLLPDSIFTIIDTSICHGETYEAYGQAGTYIDEFVSMAGCDSIRTLNLEVLPVLETYVNAIVCEGTVVNGYAETGFYVDTFSAVTGCDSLSILDLTVHDTVMLAVYHQICFGDSYMGYTVSGNYIDTFQTYQGCDSIVDLALEVVEEITHVINKTICLGDTFNGYSEPGIYQDTVLSVFGCDSISFLELNVVAEEKDVAVNICEGDFFENYNISGLYIDTLPGILEPCDTIRHLTLTVISQVTSAVSDVICEGDNYAGHTLPGIYTDTLLSVSGCDSVRTLSLALLPASFSHTTAALCDGFSFGYEQPGIYVDTLVSYNGCDSIRTLTLQSEPMYIPNVITPNGDGFNDEFTIFTPGEKPLDIAYFGIFDRFGNMTYETFTWPVIWTGKDKNLEPFNPGVFTFVLAYYCNQLRFTQTGNITLMR